MTPASPTTILVVDDSPTDQRLAGRLIEKDTEFRVAYASAGDEALAAINAAPPAAVVTDLQMPGMDGLQLVEEIRGRFPDVPVILMTGKGSEEIAIQALQAGASNYVPKRALAGMLVAALQQVLNAARLDRRRQRLLASLTHFECRLALESDPTLVPQAVAYLQEHLDRVGAGDATQRIRVGVALEEALLNGIYHGNLELGSELRQDGGDTFERLGRERRTQAPYADRRLHVHARLSRDGAMFVVRDEGRGFDVAALPDPTDPANIDRIGGRGLLLIRTFMDEATHNAAGNEITMVKRTGEGKV
jgi:CheY-like chemotaxis protein